MKEPTLTKADEALLRSQVIDNDQPGTILRDFQTVLDFVGTGGVKAGGKYNLLPIDAIGELDAKLARPLRLERTMKRPQLRSHPYLHGLHLLLRATGLTRVEGSGEKARLVLDPRCPGRVEGPEPDREIHLPPGGVAPRRPAGDGRRARRGAGPRLPDRLPA